MATKRKAEASVGPLKSVITKKQALDTSKGGQPASPLRKKGLLTLTGKGDTSKVLETSKTGLPGSPLRKKGLLNLTGILKQAASPNRSPYKSVAFTPPSNMRETLSNLGPDTSAALVHQLETLEGVSLVLWLEELQAHISLLDRRQEGGQGVESLVSELLKFCWEDKEEAAAEAYISFLANLVSACPCYTRAAVKSLFTRFKPAADQGQPNNLPKDKKTRDGIVFGRVHTALQALLAVSPVGAREEVLGQIAANFPFYKSPAYAQVCFVSALLEMTSYVPDSQHRVLSIIAEKIIKIDANLSRDFIEDVYRAVEEGGWEDNLVLSLDLLMKLLLTYVKENTHAEGAFCPSKAEPLVSCLLAIYTSHFLPTYNIVHAQYLLFYLASLDPLLTQRFLAVTWRMFISPNSSSILRQTAMSYLASFLSRSSTVSTPQLLGHLTKLTSWAHAYVRNRESADSGLDFMYTDLARHGPFYSACQAIFYIFAFRHQELTSTPKRLKLVQGLAWHSLVACGLNPLRVCLPGVVRNFSACARHYQLAYCQAVIERNNRINLPVVGSLSGGGGMTSKPLLLDCYFPYDPCVLKRTASWIVPTYLEYHGLAGIQEDEEESDSEEENDEEQEEGKEKREKRARLDSSRSSISSLDCSRTRSRQDSVGGLNELLLQDLGYGSEEKRERELSTQ